MRIPFKHTPVHIFSCAVRISYPIPDPYYGLQLSYATILATKSKFNGGHLSYPNFADKKKTKITLVSQLDLHEHLKGFIKQYATIII